MTIKKKNVVVFGGANGTAIVLRALKQYTDQLNLSAVVSMSDSGRSSAKMRNEIGVLPSADVLRVLIALSSYDYTLLKEVLYTQRFELHPKLAGFNFGTLCIGLAAKFTGDMAAVIHDFEQMLKCVGHVYPATLEMTRLNVRLSNGQTIKGEGDIDEPKGARGPVIEEAWLDPEGALYDEARTAIEQADIIITGPGDLYTSNIASLLARGTKEAIAKSKAMFVYVAGNKYTTTGEFAPVSLSARVAALEQYLPRPVDMIVHNHHVLTPAEELVYKENLWGLITPDRQDVRVQSCDFEAAGGGLSSEKLGAMLMPIIMPEKIYAKNRR